MTQSTLRSHAVSIVVRWLTLTVLGWLTYALMRALGAIIYLGTPRFDWQWYLALIALLIGLSTRVAWRRPRSRPETLLLGLLLAWLVVGYNGFGRAVRLYPARVSGVPISFWAYGGTLQVSEDVLQDLQAAGGWLYLNVGNLSGESGQASIAGLRRLAQYDIEVYLVPPLSDFLSVPVHNEWITNVQEMAATIEREGLSNVRGLVGDAEAPQHMPLDLLGTGHDDFVQAVRNLDGLIQWKTVEYPDLSLGVTALWPLYMDGLDGDADLSIIHRTPVDPPGSWDYVNVMTYSSFFPRSWRAYYVYLIERAMARRYPDHPPSHLIGLVGGGFPGEPLLDFEDLVRDARLSRAMGVPEIVVFQLDGALKVFGDDFVRRFTTAVNDVQPDMVIRVPFSRPASILVYGVATADALLDARGRKGLLLVAWMVLSGIISYGSARRAKHKGRYSSNALLIPVPRGRFLTALSSHGTICLLPWTVCIARICLSAYKATDDLSGIGQVEEGKPCQ